MMLLLALLIPLLTASHPIHLAITELAYSEKEKSLQVVHKLFVDDFELHIEQEAKARGQELRLQLNTPKEHPRSDEFLRGYLEEHFQVKVNGKAVQGVYLGKEYENDAVWVYIEFVNVPRPKQLEIYDDRLIGLYDDQNNLINLEINGKKGSLRFRKGHTKELLTF